MSGDVITDFVQSEISLNPSFGGIWCRVSLNNWKCVRLRRVLILLLVEYGVG